MRRNGATPQQDPVGAMNAVVASSTLPDPRFAGLLAQRFEASHSKALRTTQPHAAKTAQSASSELKKK